MKSKIITFFEFFSCKTLCKENQGLLFLTTTVFVGRDLCYCGLKISTGLFRVSSKLLVAKHEMAQLRFSIHSNGGLYPQKQLSSKTVKLVPSTQGFTDGKFKERYYFTLQLFTLTVTTLICFRKYKTDMYMLLRLRFFQTFVVIGVVDVVIFQRSWRILVL